LPLLGGLSNEQWPGYKHCDDLYVAGTLLRHVQFPVVLRCQVNVWPASTVAAELPKVAVMTAV